MVPGQLPSLLWKVRSDLVNTANVLSRISPPLTTWVVKGGEDLKTFLKQFHSRSPVLKIGINHFLVSHWYHTGIKRVSLNL